MNAKVRRWYFVLCNPYWVSWSTLPTGSTRSILPWQEVLCFASLVGVVAEGEGFLSSCSGAVGSSAQMQWWVWKKFWSPAILAAVFIAFLCCRGKALVSLLYLEASISPSILCKRNFCYENPLSLKCDYSGRLSSSFSLIVGFHEAAQMRPVHQTQKQKKTIIQKCVKWREWKYLPRLCGISLKWDQNK